METSVWVFSTSADRGSSRMPLMAGRVEIARAWRHVICYTVGVLRPPATQFLCSALGYPGCITDEPMQALQKTQKRANNVGCVVKCMSLLCLAGIAKEQVVAIGWRCQSNDGRGDKESCDQENRYQDLQQMRSSHEFLLQ